MKMLICLLIAGVFMMTACGTVDVQEEEIAEIGEQRRILCSTFPIYLFTSNITRGIEGIAVELLIPADLGCPHDYALSPRNMQALAEADALVINGLGMEEFLGEPVERANADLTIVDSSSGITDLLQYTDIEETTADDHDHSHDHSHEHSHDHTGVNPHIFSSPALAAVMVRNIGDQLAEEFPLVADELLANAAAYSGQLEKLADELGKAMEAVAEKRIVAQHGIFDYLARDLGLEIVAVIQPEGGHEPAAGRLLGVVELIRRSGAAAVIGQPGFSTRAGETVADEAGVPFAVLDPGSTGPDDPPLDYYQRIMRKNIQALKDLLEGR